MPNKFTDFITKMLDAVNPPPVTSTLPATVSHSWGSVLTPTSVPDDAKKVLSVRPTISITNVSTFITDDQLKKMRDAGISWVPTFTPVQEQVDHADVMGWTGETLANLKKILENHARSLQKAIALGVNVLVGSDSGSCGVAHGTGLIREMELLENAGMPTLDILCQATHGNNSLLTNRQPYGSLEKDFKPRFILTKHNPLETVKNLYLDRLVLFDGEVQDTSTLVAENL